MFIFSSLPALPAFVTIYFPSDVFLRFFPLSNDDEFFPIIGILIPLLLILLVLHRFHRFAQHQFGFRSGLDFLFFLYHEVLLNRTPNYHETIKCVSPRGRKKPLDSVRKDYPECTLRFPSVDAYVGVEDPCWETAVRDRSHNAGGQEVQDPTVDRHAEFVRRYMPTLVQGRAKPKSGQHEDDDTGYWSLHDSHRPFIVFLAQNYLHRAFWSVRYQQFRHATADRLDEIILDVWPPFETEGGSARPGNYPPSPPGGPADMEENSRFLVVILPGLRGHGGDLPGQTLVRRLATAGFRAVVVNRRGHAQLLKSAKISLSGDDADWEESLRFLDYLLVKKSAGTRGDATELGAVENGKHVELRRVSAFPPFALLGLTAGSISGCGKVDILRYQKRTGKRLDSLWGTFRDEGRGNANAVDGNAEAAKGAGHSSGDNFIFTAPKPKTTLVFQSEGAEVSPPPIPTWSQPGLSSESECRSSRCLPAINRRIPAPACQIAITPGYDTRTCMAHCETHYSRCMMMFSVYFFVQRNRASLTTQISTDSKPKNQKQQNLDEYFRLLSSPGPDDRYQEFFDRGTVYAFTDDEVADFISDTLTQAERLNPGNSILALSGHMARSEVRRWLRQHEYSADGFDFHTLPLSERFSLKKQLYYAVFNPGSFPGDPGYYRDEQGDPDHFRRTPTLILNSLNDPCVTSVNLHAVPDIPALEGGNERGSERGKSLLQVAVEDKKWEKIVVVSEFGSHLPYFCDGEYGKNDKDHPDGTGQSAKTKIPPGVVTAAWRTRFSTNTERLAALNNRGGSSSTIHRLLAWLMRTAFGRYGEEADGIPAMKSWSERIMVEYLTGMWEREVTQGRTSWE